MTIQQQTAFGALTPDITRVTSFDVVAIDGSPVSLSTFHDRVLLIVNTASACGFTPQFAGLELLWQTYRERGLTVIGFPSNEFGAQDPGSNASIAQYCQANYGVSFPMMEKLSVNGSDAHPLYQWLKARAPGLLGSESIKWNFTKFLVGRDGLDVKRFAPNAAPASLARDIEDALGH